MEPKSVYNSGTAVVARPLEIAMDMLRSEVERNDSVVIEMCGRLERLLVTKQEAGNPNEPPKPQTCVPYADEIIRLAGGLAAQRSTIEDLLLRLGI